MEKTRHHVARAEEIATGTMRRVEVAGHALAIFKVDGAFYAIDDRCTHMKGRLSDGYLEGHIVECPLHFGRFDVRTGRAISAPCTVDVAAYPVEVIDGMIVVPL